VIVRQSNLLQQYKHTGNKHIKTIELTAISKGVSGGFAVKKAKKAFCSADGEKTFLAFFV
jgi:hypothetical protein